MDKLNINQTGYVVGFVSLVFFLLCSVWGVLLGPELKDLHFNLLQMAYPGFAFTAIGYTIGLIESFIYGWFFGALFAWLCRRVCVSER